MVTSQLVMVRSFDARAPASAWSSMRDDGGADPWIWRRQSDPAAALRRAPGLVSTFAGQLRTAHLFADRVVVTDAQLLDGIFFQALGPRRLHDLIGRSDIDPPVLQIACRADTLAESLRQFVAGPDAAVRHLKYTELSTVTATGRAVDFEGLRGHSAAAVRAADPSDLGHVCARELAAALGLPAGELNALGEAWTQWLRAADEGQVLVRRNEMITTAQFADAAADWEGPVEAAPKLTESLRGQRIRSIAIKEIRDATLTEEQKDALQEWYDHLYQDALAANLGADWLDLRTHRPAATRASEPARPTPARAGRIALASSAVVRLGEMSVSGFTALTSQHREALQAWRADRTKRTTARVAFAIEQHFAVEDLERARRRTLTGSLASVAVALMAFMFDAFSLINASWAFLLLGLALAFTIVVGVVPYLRQWSELRRFQSGTASIYLAGANGDG